MKEVAWHSKDWPKGCGVLNLIQAIKEKIKYLKCRKCRFNIEIEKEEEKKSTFSLKIPNKIYPSIMKITHAKKHKKNVSILCEH